MRSGFIGLLLSLSGLFSCECTDRDVTKTKFAPIVETVDTTAFEAYSAVDTMELWESDTFVVLGERYMTCWYGNRICSLNEKRDTVFFLRSDCNGFITKDFNADGCLDLQISYLTNTPGIYDIALFDRKQRKFQLIENMQNFPEPVRVGSTGYYYSYHRSGCADANWDSDLFKIEKNKAVCYGNISGLGCEDEEKNGIFISRVKGDQLTLIKEIKRSHGFYADKWDFIDDYWRKNYFKFH